VRDLEDVAEDVVRRLLCVVRGRRHEDELHEGVECGVWRGLCAVLLPSVLVVSEPVLELVLGT
jgi:hypothetical protein